jgi:1-aminocyclopropane-1-carboxylate deaminase
MTEGMTEGLTAAPALRIPSPVTELADDRLAARGVRLWLKRDDLIHPDLPGNKWRKLAYNLQAAVTGGHRTLLTFGGAYSGHIRATAAAGHYFGFGTVGIIRGEPHLPLNPVLAQATGHGMALQYLDRGRYRAKDDPALLARLREQWGDFYLLPEGGSNALAARGCAELGAEIDSQLETGYDVVCCPAGTGGTLAGLAAGLAPGQRAVGFPVLKGGQFLAGAVRRLQREAFGGPAGQWQLECGFHHGGYARRTAELDAFIADFATRHGQVLDWVYVAKMMTGIYALAGQDVLPSGSRVVAVITG